jgi:(1->4)-alpha-D-glucan 1-alpha-D-glucosylmutase
LQARKEKLRLFQDGAYLPLEAGGIFKSNVLSFARNQGNDWSITIIPRLMAGIVGEGAYPVGREIWKDTCLLLPEHAPALWKNFFSQQPVAAEGRSLPVASALEHFPVALLIA